MNRRLRGREILQTPMGKRHPSFEDLWNFRGQIAGADSQGNWDRDGGWEKRTRSLAMTLEDKFKMRKVTWKRWGLW
jgi:hypothetical protein